jgi:RNA polymerase sigma-70 factor, ECF subfamily
MVTAWSASESSNDVSLVAAARDGDRAAFGGLYARYSRMIHGILLARVPAGDVEDLVQDVFLRALPRLHTLRDESRFGAWLATIARNRAVDYHRQSKSVRVNSDGLCEEEAEGPVSDGVKEREAAAILEVVRSLPETYRETLVLRLVEGMTGPEIAARTGLTPGSVRVNLHRGMQQLREKLSGTLGTEAPRGSLLENGSAAKEKRDLRKRNEL